MTSIAEIYTLSLHDALPICSCAKPIEPRPFRRERPQRQPENRSSRREPARIFLRAPVAHDLDRKSTRLNSSHPSISYAVFCLKKKKYEKQVDIGQEQVRVSQ